MKPTNRFITLSVFVATCFLGQSALSQEETSNKVSAIAALGLHESIVGSINIPIVESVNAGVKLNRIVTGGGKNGVLFTGLGFGVTSSYQYSDHNSFLNVTTIELAYLYHMFEANSPSKGYNFQFTLGHRNESKGFNLIWGAGVSLTTFSNSTSYLFPCVQIGVQWNK